jgi:hypothetical protein
VTAPLSGSTLWIQTGILNTYLFSTNPEEKRKGDWQIQDRQPQSHGGPGNFNDKFELIF